MKITHSLVAKDTIAVGRGIYKVIEGGVSAYRADNIEINMKKSWHSNPEVQSKSEPLNSQKS